MIVGDWGTSRLRLFRIEDGAVAERRDGPGIGALDGPEAAAAALLRAAGPWRDGIGAEGILLCGMAGSRIGLRETRYAPCPAGPDDWAGDCATVTLDGLPVRIAPGLSGTNFAGASDVMRGEETQIFGAVRLRPELAQARRTLVLPGTHSKWAGVAGGRVARIHSFFTGELFALLRERSTLLRGGAGDGGGEDGFAHGLARAAAVEPLAALFETRAAQLVDGRDAGWAAGFLSGLLIGGEIREGLRLAGTDAGAPVLIGDPALVALYARAFRGYGTSVETLDGDACVLAGLALLGERIGA